MTSATTKPTMGLPASAPPSDSPLATYRLLSPSASIRVSPLCLGAMSFGTAWTALLGACPQPTAFAMLDAFRAAGGNFIDTANNYHAGESEAWLGEWMEARGCREEMVIATKYTGAYATDMFAQRPTAAVGEVPMAVAVNTVGNGLKSMNGSLRKSLQRLRTGYVDVFYVHFWDYSAGVEEVVMGLNALVQQGLILYLGVSDTPAWIVVKANAFARQHGLRPFSVYQGNYSVLSRDLEREILPMCAAEGMGVVPFGTLGAGALKTREQREKAEGLGSRSLRETDERTLKMCEVLEKVAKRHGDEVGMTSIALAWARAKVPYLTPIVGGRSVEHLKANVEALRLVLSEDDVKEIESAVAFDFGFPYNYFGRGASQVAKLLESVGKVEFVEPPKPIKAVGGL